MRRVYAMIAYRESIQSNDFHAMELLSSPGYVLATSEKLSKQLEKEGDPGTHFDRFPNELPDHTQVKTLDDLMLSQEKWKEKIREDEDTRRAGTIAAAIHGSFEKASEKQRSGHTFLPKGTELVHQIMPVQRRDLVALYKLIDEQIYVIDDYSSAVKGNLGAINTTYDNTIGHIKGVLENILTHVYAMLKLPAATRAALCENVEEFYTVDWPREIQHSKVARNNRVSIQLTADIPFQTIDLLLQSGVIDYATFKHMSARLYNISEELVSKRKTDPRLALEAAAAKSSSSSSSSSSTTKTKTVTSEDETTQRLAEKTKK